MNPFAYDAISGHGIDALDIMRAVIVRSSVVLAIVVMIRYFLRDRLSNAAKHALLLIVPFETAAVLAFAIWPMRIELQLPFDSPVSPLLATFAGGSVDPGTKDVKTATLQPIDWSFDERSAIASSEAPTGFSQGLSSSALDPTNDRTGQVPIMSDSGRTDATSLSTIAGICWFAGSSLLAFIFLVRHLRMSFRLRSTWGPASYEMRHMVDSLAKLMRLRHRPGIMETRAVATPAVVGIFRPVLVIPAGFEDEFEADECRWALAHELAHVQRFDLWTLAFERAVGIVCFFCPALWITQRMTRHDRELACDDAAQAASGLSAGDCAGVFLKLIRWSSRRESGSGGMTPVLSLTHRYPAIRRRIMNMTDTNESRRAPRLSRNAIASCTVVAVLAALPVVPKIVAESPQEPKTNKETKANPDASKSKNVNSIGGVVVDEKEKPVSNAEIKVIALESYYLGGKPRLIASARSDASGRFRITDIPSSEQTPLIQFTHPEFSYDAIALRPADSYYRSLIEGNAKFKLYKGTNFRGKVVDPDGKPVAGATVQSVRPFFFVESRDMTTDSMGEFECRHAAPRGLDAFVFRKPGFGLAVSKTMNTGKFPDPLIVSLDKPKAFRAMVTDDQGKPLAGVTVEMRLRTASNFEVARIITGKDGRVSFENLPASQDLAVHIYKPGFNYDLRTIVASDIEDKRIEMRRSIALSGNVTDRTSGGPVARFDVRLEGFDDSEKRWKRSSYDDFYSGRYRFDLLSVLPKTFRLVFESAGYRPFFTETYTLETYPAKLDVKLDPIPVEEWPRYRGKILGIDGKPIADVKLGLFTESDYPHFENGKITRTERERPIPQTDASGNFDFRSPEPVKEIILLHESGVLRQNVGPETNQTGLEWKLQPYGRIAGFMRRNGKPDVETQIVLNYPSGVKDHTGPLMLIEQNADGAFVVDKVIPGQVRIDFRLSGVSINDQTNIWKIYLIEPGKTTTIERDLKLNDVPRRTIKGKLRFSDDRVRMNMSQSRISLWATEGSPLRLSRELPYENSPERLRFLETPEGKALHQALEEFVLLEKTISPEGAFEIKGVPAGTYELHIWPGNLNVFMGQAKQVFRIDPADVDQNTPIDLGEIEVINPNAPKTKSKTSKPGDAGKDLKIPDSK